MKKKPENWTARGVQKAICNPFYIDGFVVDPRLTTDRPDDYDLNEFLSMANEFARIDGFESTLRSLLKKLKTGFPILGWISMIPIHPCFSEAHEGIVNEEQFIAAAVAQVAESRMTVNGYFRNMAENLSQACIPLPRQEAQR